MRTLKKILFFVLGLVVALLLVGYFFIQSLKPDYHGKVQLSGMAQEVEVYFDDYGIPHIYGASKPDAYRALGYVHAQDRLWQMELLRRIAKGRLSEVFGKEMLETDKLFLTLGISRNTQKVLQNIDLSQEMFVLANAYLEGVNGFIEKGPTPPEFYLTGIEKTPFTLADIYDALGYMAFSFAQAHKTDPLLSNLRSKLGATHVASLLAYGDEPVTWIKSNPEINDTLRSKIGSMVAAAMDKLPIPPFIGSNSWVIGPKKTKSGKVILANDPHIGFAQPSVWYEAHVVAPNYEKYGYHLAGIPFPLLGHNRELAYGLTMFENDDIEFYLEENHPDDPNQYKTEEGWQTYETVTHTIPVKDGETEQFSYKISRHGPILSGIAQQIEVEAPIAMSWIYTQRKNTTLEAVYGISHATNINEFQSSLKNIHAPGLNVMYGDAEGNIAWWASGQLYTLPDSLSTKMVMNGSDGRSEIQEYLPFSDNPQAVNPPWNYVYSANNQPDTVKGRLFPGYYLPENRAKRIVQLLEDKNDWDAETAQQMILDVTSSVNPQIAQGWINILEKDKLTEVQKETLQALQSWDGGYELENTVAGLYHRWLYQILQNTFKDEMGERYFNEYMATHLMKRVIAPQNKDPQSIWWDNVSTSEIETQKDIITQSLTQAWESLVSDLGENPKEWKWEKLHTLEHNHPFGQVEQLRSYFNVGPFPIEGSREVINNLMFDYDETGYYKVSAGPSTRRVIDFSNIEASKSILPTGQSGNPLSKHYKDQAEMYVKGKFRPMLMNEKEIKKEGRRVLVIGGKT